MTALLEVVDALTVVALSHLFSDEPGHHALDPLLADNGVLGGLELLVVVVIDAIEGRGYRGLSRQELRRLWSRHCEGLGVCRDVKRPV